MNKIKLNDIKFINIAIDISRESEFPYGAIVVKNDNIIGRSDSEIAGSNIEYFNPELIAIKDANKNNVRDMLKGSVLYISCEPCAMSMGKIIRENIVKLVYAANLKDLSKYVDKEYRNSFEIIKEEYSLDIEIVEKLERKKAVSVLKEWNNKKYLRG